MAEKWIFDINFSKKIHPQYLRIVNEIQISLYGE